jgi:hypothetical protein
MRGNQEKTGTGSESSVSGEVKTDAEKSPEKMAVE